MSNIKYTTFSVKEQIIKRFADKYDLSELIYVDRKTKFKIGCQKHGMFETSLTSILRSGEKCRKCRNEQKSIAYSGTIRENRLKYNNESIIIRFNEIHYDKYVYKDVDYQGMKKTIDIECSKHGIFRMSIIKHLSGQGCPKCSGKNLSTADVILDFKNIHGDTYDYSKLIFKNQREKMTFICYEHGEFKQTYYQHCQKNPIACQECRENKQSLKLHQILEKFKKSHGNLYDYSNVKPQQSIQTNVEIICKKHGSFMQRIDNHFAGKGCPKCKNSSSQAEKDVGDFIESLGIKIKRNDKIVLDKKEIDVLSIEHRLGIEYNGLYWHSDRSIKKNYQHYEKTILAESKGYQLIHLYEDEWLGQNDIVKSRIRSMFNKSENRIFARKTKLIKLTIKQAKEFFIKNHIQGHVFCKYYYGLEYNNEIVAAMSLSKRKILGNSEIELVRFANILNTNVIGGASKLLNAFIKEMQPKSIISYADRSWSTGKLYETLGFERLHETKPNYYYVLNNKRLSRYQFQKHLIVKTKEERKMTEKEIMVKNGYDILYDSGSIKYRLNLTS